MRLCCGLVGLLGFFFFEGFLFVPKSVCGSWNTFLRFFATMGTSDFLAYLKEGSDSLLIASFF